ETGIAADTFTPNYTVVTHNTIYKGYVTIIDMAKDSIVLQKGETVAYRWVEKEEFLKILESNQFVPARRKRLEGFVAEL
ncbi:MAG TPA: NUDIX hydrolase, partial [Lachnospiraceae bacterium]|nr:NUDIX hydrolase [Lachnospiraceae bacterium]